MLQRRRIGAYNLGYANYCFA